MAKRIYTEKAMNAMQRERDSYCEQNLKHYEKIVQLRADITQLKAMYESAKGDLEDVMNGHEKTDNLVIELQAENKQLQKRLMEHGEALQILAQLRQLYCLCPNMKDKKVESAVKLMIREAEKGLQLAHQRRQEEYIKQLLAENKEFEKELVATTMRRDELQADLKRAAKQIKRLNKALSAYGNHLSKCAYVQGLKGSSIEDCDCGFEQALNKGD